MTRITFKNLRLQALLAFVLLVSASGVLHAQSAAPVRGKIVYIEGDVRLQKAARAEEAAVLGQELDENDTLSTGPASQMRVRLYDQSVIRLGPNSRIQLARLAIEPYAVQKEISIRLLAGKVWSHVSRLLSSQSRFEVVTPNAVAGVRGTSFEVSLGGIDGNQATFTCLEGLVGVYARNAPDVVKLISEGTQVALTANGLGDVMPVDFSSLLDKERQASGGALFEFVRAENLSEQVFQNTYIPLHAPEEAVAAAPGTAPPAKQGKTFNDLAASRGDSALTPAEQLQRGAANVKPFNDELENRARVIINVKVKE